MLDLATGKTEKLGKLKGFTVSDDQPVLFYHLDKPEPKKADGKKDDEEKEKGGGGEKPEKSEM